MSRYHLSACRQLLHHTHKIWGNLPASRHHSSACPPSLYHKIWGNLFVRAPSTSLSTIILKNTRFGEICQLPGFICLPVDHHRPHTRFGEIFVQVSHISLLTKSRAHTLPTFEISEQVWPLDSSFGLREVRAIIVLDETITSIQRSFLRLFELLASLRFIEPAETQLLRMHKMLQISAAREKISRQPLDTTLRSICILCLCNTTNQYDKASLATTSYTLLHSEYTSLVSIT